MERRSIARRLLRLLPRVEVSTAPGLTDREIRAVLAKLSPRERAIIRLRFRVGDPPAPGSLDRLSPAALRRLETRALRNLRADAVAAQRAADGPGPRLRAVGS